MQFDFTTVVNFYSSVHIRSPSQRDKTHMRYVATNPCGALDKSRGQGSIGVATPTYSLNAHAEVEKVTPGRT